MTAHDPLLRTRQVAEAYGVSVSTIKRWVDAGVLRGGRTAGKHRLIPLSEALSCASRQGLSVERLNALAGARGSDVARETEGDSVAALVRAFHQGELTHARSVLRSAYARHGSAALADLVIRPAMERIGHAWASGTMDVYQEHEAIQLISSTVVALIQRMTRPRDEPSPLALGAAPEGDPYDLALRLGELVLREGGWDVRNLGPNLPLRSLGHAAIEYQPRLIFLSVSHLDNEERFAREYQAFHRSAASVGAAVILGGRALGPDLRASLVYAGFGERLTHLSEFARRMFPRGAERESLARVQNGSSPNRNGSPATAPKED
ncbi:MAG: helix-turn-helix domain-containing protein [Isosphaeraceae bacterium]